MTLTQAADRAVIKAKGASARRKRSSHLWKQAVLLRAREIRAALRRGTKREKSLPLFEVRT